MSHMITMEEYEERIYEVLGKEDERKHFHPHAAGLFLEFLQNEFGVFTNQVNLFGSHVVNNAYALVVNAKGEYIFGLDTEILGESQLQTPNFYGNKELGNALKADFPDYESKIIDKLKELDALDEDVLDKMSADKLAKVIASSKLIPPEVLQGLVNGSAKEDK